MAKSRRKPSVWDVVWNDAVYLAPPPKPKKPRKRTPAQKLELVVERAMRSYGVHCRLCGEIGWLPFTPRQDGTVFVTAQRSIRRILREVARG